LGGHDSGNMRLDKTDHDEVYRAMGKKKRRGAKILGILLARSLMRSRRPPITTRGTDVAGWLSFKSPQSILSAFSYGSILSFGSILSIGSAGSILSIGSSGSILSIGSAGSVLSIGSVGSMSSIGSAGAPPPGGPDETEAELPAEPPPPPGPPAPPPPSEPTPPGTPSP
jgi:hypothetical protein